MMKSQNSSPLGVVNKYLPPRPLEESLPSVAVEVELDSLPGEDGPVDVGPGVSHVLVVPNVEHPADDIKNHDHAHVLPDLVAAEALQGTVRPRRLEGRKA